MGKQEGVIVTPTALTKNPAVGKLAKDIIARRKDEAEAMSTVDMDRYISDEDVIDGDYHQMFSLLQSNGEIPKELSYDDVVLWVDKRGEGQFAVTAADCQLSGFEIFEAIAA